MTRSFDGMRIYGTVKVGGKGQIVIPSKARKDFGLKPGDLLLVVRGPGKRGIALVKADAVKELLGKITRGLSGSESEV